jgi:hypothetical protein
MSLFLFYFIFYFLVLTFFFGPNPKILKKYSRRRTADETRALVLALFPDCPNRKRALKALDSSA